MLMRFHFGLGVRHVYSHYRSAPADLLPEGNTQCIPEDDVDVDGDTDDYDSESQEDDDGASRVEVVGERFGDSNESLSEQFDEMYGSDIDLDYEN
jgi:hypothetical protein